MAVEVRQQFVEAEVNLMKDTIWRLTGRVFALENFIKKKFGDIVDTPSGYLQESDAEVGQKTHSCNCSKDPTNATPITKKRIGTAIRSQGTESVKKRKTDDKKVNETTKRELRVRIHKMVEEESSSSDDDLDLGSSSDSDEEEHSIQNIDDTSEQNFEQDVPVFKTEGGGDQREEQTNDPHISSLTTVVELSPGSGIYLTESDLSTAKFMSNGSPNLLARHLFRRLYRPEELYGHSLLGKPCNANKNARLPLPAVEPKRKDAILAYVLNFHGYTLPSSTDPGSKEKKKVKEKEYGSMKREITKSLSDFMREVNKKHRKQNK